MILARVASSACRFGSPLLCLLFAACAEDGATPAPGPTACEWVNAKRQSCCLEAFECITVYDECFSECLVGWGCAEQADPGSDPGIVACLWNCAPRFTCDDGSEIYAAFRCDGEGDCEGSEDEANCPGAASSAAPRDASAPNAPSTDAALTEATPAAQTYRDAASSAAEMPAPREPLSRCDAAVLISVTVARGDAASPTKPAPLNPGLPADRVTSVDAAPRDAAAAAVVEPDATSGRDAGPFSSRADATAASRATTPDAEVGSSVTYVVTE